MENADTDSHADGGDEGKRKWQHPKLDLAQAGRMSGIDGCDSCTQSETFEHLMEDDDDVEGGEGTIWCYYDCNSNQQGMEDDSCLKNQHGCRVVLCPYLVA